MNKLIKMEDYILEQNEFGLYKHNADDIRAYAKLLKSKPTLSMFIPCDDDGNVLGEPSDESMSRYLNSQVGSFDVEYTHCLNYQSALDKVIFDGWSVAKKGVYHIGIKNNDEDVILFYSNGEVFYNGNFINTISDLTPYNLKLK